MVAIADAMNTAARACSVTPPASWIGASTLTHVELRDDFLAQTVDELLDRVEWPSPIGKVQTIAGDGSTSYDLASDFKRLKRKLAIYESANTRRFGVPMTSEAEYQYLTDVGSAGAYRYFRTAGYDGAHTIEFFPASDTGDSINVSYISNLWKASNAGVAGSTWTADEDVLLLPRRLVELGVEWRFKRSNEIAYSDPMAEYELRLARTANDVQLIRRISGAEGQDFKPMRHPVPDFIPPS